MTVSGGARAVLVGGHESRNGADLQPLLRDLPGAVVTASGRPLHDVVTTLLAADDAPVAVLPMTWGRDPRLVADSARTLHWLARGPGAGRIALCAPFGTADHLVALLRRAATETAARHPGAAVVVSAPTGGPFDDAELHRVAHLVRTHGAGPDVEVACVAAPADLARAVHRARALGAPEVVVVPAGFATSDPLADALDDATSYGPLVAGPAVARIVRERVAAAEHALQHGDDGVADGLLADHDHGYAHSHAGVPGGGGHPHEHGPGAPHEHGHAHPHAHPHAHHEDGTRTPGLVHSHPA
ncbi:sirohydrochlorin chelatase [Cellulomonas shaoxiangyii]|uniref:Cobalamin biosynthesis protein CbiX n=1 Tax=Cellulomonas shaoxiangyii TaxID=2566013 RepID=A0A4P7SJA0_9CELL|nr:cobalamin biosynthesis protein CbiX [Cellulomonas shaoxiangyii]QCB93768.1 cobalamin biosynthesis protein CbiX [Cellulomonas shaoxiangyii]TGY81880.1 cobalamin biosynthesis protein CbiX [Cellulomonas shaoxiangyii]